MLNMSIGCQHHHFFSYVGISKVGRADGATLNSSNAAVGYSHTTTLKIKNFDNYENTHSGESVEYAYMQVKHLDHISMT